MAAKYWIQVYTGKAGTVYSGSNEADALTEWTKRILDGDEYVTLEALRERDK